MVRFYVDLANRKGNLFEICGEDVNHIRNVLRMKTGEELILCDKEGTDFFCRLLDTRNPVLMAEIIEEKPSESELPVHITLFQGLPKKDKMELIIQKAVELGADEIIPVITSRTIVKTEDGKEEKKLARFQAIAESAAKQSGRGIIPKVPFFLSFQEALAYQKNFDYNVILYENERGMKATAEAVKEASQKKSIGILVGPEGGFTEQEVELAKKAGAKSLSLGKRILRTETAGFTMLSLFMLAIECREDNS